MGTSHETAIFTITKSKKLIHTYGWGLGERPVLTRTGLGKFDFGLGRVKEGWEMNNKHIRGGHIS